MSEDDNMVKKNVKIILSGSGIKGAYQYGFILSLMKSNKYNIQKIFATSIGSLNSLLASKYDFDLFWENYGSIVSKKETINAVSQTLEIFPSYKWLGSTIDNSLSQMYNFVINPKVDVNIFNNFLKKQIDDWYEIEEPISISISKKTEKKTHIYEIDDNVKKNIPKIFLEKYLKDIILDKNIFELYDDSYLRSNELINEFIPFKAMINDALNSDNNDCVYILLSLQSNESILKCFDKKENISENICENNVDIEYITNMYKYNQIRITEYFSEMQILNFYNYPLFIFHIEDRVLQDYDKIDQKQFITNCTDNGKYHFNKFDEIIDEKCGAIFDMIFGPNIDTNNDTNIDYFN
jgi:hypothetical protein